MEDWKVPAVILGILVLLAGSMIGDENRKIDNAENVCIESKAKGLKLDHCLDNPINSRTFERVCIEAKAKGFKLEQCSISEK